MKELEVENNYLFDYIYIPFDNESDLSLENEYVYRNDLIVKSKNIYSPISGRIYGKTDMNFYDSQSEVLVIENDFKDLINKSYIRNKDIYNVDIPKLDILNKSEIILKITNDINLSLLFKDNIVNILETLNVINIKTKKNVKILLDKRNIYIYELLFSYIGTYPNIDIIFNSETYTLDVYEIIDLYNLIRNNPIRDFIYIELSNKKDISILKVKKYCNLKELLYNKNISFNKDIVINDKVKTTNLDYIIDEKINKIYINWQEFIKVYINFI